MKQTKAALLEEIRRLNEQVLRLTTEITSLRKPKSLLLEMADHYYWVANHSQDSARRMAEFSAFCAKLGDTLCEDNMRELDAKRAAVPTDPPQSEKP